MMSWGEEGEGRWITVYANAGHAYMTVAGFRFDTAGDEGEETGPRWHEELRDQRRVRRAPPDRLLARRGRIAAAAHARRTSPASLDTAVLAAKAPRPI